MGELWFSTAIRAKRIGPFMQVAKFLTKKSSSRFLDIRMDVTNQCNLQCEMCYFSLPEKRMEKPVFMSLELFRKIARDVFPKAIFTTLSCGAESLVHPKFHSMLEIARPVSSYLKFSTNGLLLDGKLAELCVRLPVNEIIFSIDSPEKETFESIRKGASFEKLVENLKRLEEIKEKNNSALPFTTFNLVLMKSNIEQLPSYVEFAKELHASRVACQHLRVFAGLDIEKESLLGCKELANKKISEARKLAKELGIVFSAPLPLSEAEVDGIKLCDRPWTFLNLWPTGEVLPCDAWHGQEPLGDLSKNGFDEIWNGEAYEQLRESIKTGNGLRECCANCRLFAEATPKGIAKEIKYGHGQGNK